MRLSEGEVAAPKNKKSFTNHDANPNLFRKSKQHACRDRAAVWNRKKNAAWCSSNNVRLLTNRCNCAEWGRSVVLVPFRSAVSHSRKSAWWQKRSSARSYISTSIPRNIRSDISILSNIYQEVLVPECNTVEVRFGQNKLCFSLSRRWSARPGRRRSARCWRSSSARGSMRASASRCLNKSAQMSLTQCAILYR